MKPLRSAIIALSVIFAFSLASAQDYAPPSSLVPDGAALKAIAEKTRKLGQIIESLRRQGVRDPYLAEVEIFHKAATWIVRHQEFYHKDAGAGRWKHWTEACCGPAR